MARRGRAKGSLMLPLLDEEQLRCPISTELVRVLYEVGAFQFRLAPPAVARMRATLEAARAFFTLPGDEKRALGICHSPHLRGYSEMHNERDWREQLHLGREDSCSSDGDRTDYGCLVGPNQWPVSLGKPWKEAMLTHLDETAALGQRLLETLARVLGTATLPFDKQAYLVMKLICYYPQHCATAPRVGVASHVDYSLLTLVAQDEAGGLEVQLLARADARNPRHEETASLLR
jgi:isopenicillin N synthase-like dioxygenase